MVCAFLPRCRRLTSLNLSYNNLTRGVTRLDFFGCPTGFKLDLSAVAQLAAAVRWGGHKAGQAEQAEQAGQAEQAEQACQDDEVGGVGEAQAPAQGQGQGQAEEQARPGTRAQRLRKAQEMQQATMATGGGGRSGGGGRGGRGGGGGGGGRGVRGGRGGGGVGGGGDDGGGLGLRTLYLAGNSLGADGAKEFAKALKSASLTHLDLADNNLVNRGAQSNNTRSWIELDGLQAFTKVLVVLVGRGRVGRGG
jgi:hypothetical protein